MDKGAELFGCGLSGKDGDTASVAHAKCGGDALLELKLDTLRDQKVDEAFPVLAYFAFHPLREIGERCALGLGHIENVGRTKTDEYRLILLGDVLLGLAVLLLANPDLGSEN